MDELQENQEQHDISNASFHSSFSRIRSDELNNMGYGLSKINPITFEGDVFQTPKNQPHDTALMSTPRKKRNEMINKTFPETRCQDNSSNPGPNLTMQSCLSQARVQLNCLVDSYHQAQLMQITLQLDHQRIHRILTRLQYSMGSQLVQISPGILACRHHPANQHLQESPE